MRSLRTSALTVTAGVVVAIQRWVGPGEHIEVTTTSHEVIMRSWTQVLSWGGARSTLPSSEDNLLLCQGRSTTGETSFMLRTEAAQLTFCLWAAHLEPPPGPGAARSPQHRSFEPCQPLVVRSVPW